jgi:hypothetical protein
LDVTIPETSSTKKNGVLARLIPRELKNFYFYKESKRDTAPIVCYSFVLYLIWAFEKVVLKRTQAP